MTDAAALDGTTRRRWVRTPCLLAAALTLAACGSGGGDVEGASLESGATKAEYISAFENIEPISLTLQLPYALGSIEAEPFEIYTSEVEEWSGEKITFEILYSSSRVPFEEVPDALRDGLIDMGLHAYVDQAEQLPLTSASTELMYLHDTSPVLGTAQLMASWFQYGLEAEQVKDELTENGLQPLVPLVAGASATFLCSDEPVTSLDSAQNKLTMATSPLNAQEVEALGASLVDVAPTESFEALERGSLDCFTASPGSAMTFGLFEAADHWTLEGLSLAAGATGFNMSKRSWDDLPVTAQQLLWDKLDAYFPAVMESIFLRWGAAFEEVDEYGVTLHTADDDIIDALQAFRTELINDPTGPAASALGEDTVALVQDLHESSLTELEGLGYSADTTWEDFPAWLESTEMDFSDVVDELASAALATHRPTS